MHSTTAPSPTESAAPPDEHVTCPRCQGTNIEVIGHPNDPTASEVPCLGCDGGYIDLDEAIDRGLIEAAA